ncbi:MAG: DoxX family protein [Polyangiaceae bacterium]|nr:DoxX family protein [Polyangiaceae bacterium]
MTTRPISQRIFDTRAPRAVLIIRILVGWVFVSEGVQKFLFPAEVGSGRFAKIGIPMPDVMGPFVGVVETVCGSLLLAGLGTRIAAGILIVNMLVAITSTKIPILLGRGFWGFAAPKARSGIWSMLHEARTDFSMVLGSVFLLVVGAGRRSLDARIASRLGGERNPSCSGDERQ